MLQNLKGVFVVPLIILNIVFWFIPIFVFAIVRLLLPFTAVRKWTSSILIACGENWITVNGIIHDVTQDTHWHFSGLDSLRRRDWYLVAANHQSWVDIVVLQRALNRRIPFLKFFIKQQLIWIPFLGLAWWAMDMPFMKRYSRSYLRKYPEKRGQDLEATRRSCERFREVPTSVINFVEGTRFTEAKHEKSQSPYKNLLPPKAGGVAFALSVMGEQFRSILDVTVIYPGGAKTFWDMCTGRLTDVIIDVREVPIEPWMTSGDYLNDDAFKAQFRDWMDAFWVEKDRRFDALTHQFESQASSQENSHND
ncbi:MAG: acyltransferase [Pseudomonadota bacterium]